MSAIDDFSERFNQVLRDHGWQDCTDKELSARFDVSNTTVWNWRNARKLPAMETALSMAGILGVNVEWLLTGQGPKTQADCLDLSRLSREQSAHIKALVDALRQPEKNAQCG